jgi:hypothetical protein
MPIFNRSILDSLRPTKPAKTSNKKRNQQGPNKSRIAITHRNLEHVRQLKHPDESMTDYLNAILAEALAKEKAAGSRSYSPEIRTK